MLPAGEGKEQTRSPGNQNPETGSLDSMGLRSVCSSGCRRLEPSSGEIVVVIDEGSLRSGSGEASRRRGSDDPEVAAGHGDRQTFVLERAIELADSGCFRTPDEAPCALATEGGRGKTGSVTARRAVTRDMASGLWRCRDSVPQGRALGGPDATLSSRPGRFCGRRKRRDLSGPALTLPGEGQTG